MIVKLMIFVSNKHMFSFSNLLRAIQINIYKNLVFLFSVKLCD